MMNRLLTLIGAALISLTAAAQAQQSAAPSSAPQTSQPAQGATATAAAPAPAASAASEPERLPYMPWGNLSKASPEDIKRSQELARSIVNDMLSAYETRRTPEMDQTVQRIRQRADDIADAAISAERDKVLEFLGIDPQADTALYYFVSWSMPLDMLRSYAIEAMWSGGTLVFRGVPEGRSIGQFLTTDLRQLVYGKGAAANISIDPRMFDAYNIKTVPTMVFTTVRTDMQCQGVRSVPVIVDKKEASYDACPELDEKNYWKVSGAVTSSYALQAFIDSGAQQAQPYLKAISRGWAGQSAPGKEQRAFTGKWEDVISPAERAAAEEAGKALLSKTPRP